RGRAAATTCSIVARPCRPEIIASPFRNGAAEDGHQIVGFETAAPLLAEAIRLHDAVVLLVAPHLVEDVLGNADAPPGHGLGAAILFARDRQAQGASVGRDGLDDEVI